MEINSSEDVEKQKKIPFVMTFYICFRLQFLFSYWVVYFQQMQQCQTFSQINQLILQNDLHFQNI